jgi:hypothetical protein
MDQLPLQTTGPDPAGDLKKKSGDADSRRFIIFVRTRLPSDYHTLPPAKRSILETSIRCSMAVLEHAKRFGSEVLPVEIDDMPKSERPSWLNGVPILLDMNLPLGPDGDYQRKKGKEAIEHIEYQANLLSEATDAALMQAPPMKNTCTPCDDPNSWSQSSSNQPVYSKNGVQFDTVPAHSAMASIEAKYIDKAGKVSAQDVAEYQRLREQALQQHIRGRQHSGQQPTFQQLHADGTPVTNSESKQPGGQPSSSSLGWEATTPGNPGNLGNPSRAQAAFEEASRYLKH